MGAMPEEVEQIIPAIQNLQKSEIGNRIFYSGTINNINVVVAFSKWGKVAASITASVMILHFKVNEIIFTGVAGGIADHLNIGDIVIGRNIYQHDMDARPLIKQFEIPLTGKLFFECDEEKINHYHNVISKSIIEKKSIDKEIIDYLESIQQPYPKLYIGDIASGDQFIHEYSIKKTLQEKIPTILCVEMEGAAVAQVCHEYKIPFSLIRIISDNANNNSLVDFEKFVENIASKYTHKIIQALFF